MHICHNIIGRFESVKRARNHVRNFVLWPAFKCWYRLPAAQSVLFDEDKMANHTSDDSDVDDEAVTLLMLHGSLLAFADTIAVYSSTSSNGCHLGKRLRDANKRRGLDAM